MRGADVGVKDILVLDADLCALIGTGSQGYEIAFGPDYEGVVGATGINVRCKVGNRPQGQKLPAVTVNVNSVEAQNVKGATAPCDHVEIYVYSYGATELDGRKVANAVRAAIDGKKDIVTTPNSINIGLIWFMDEQYFDDMIPDGLVHHYEQRYFVKINNN